MFVAIFGIGRVDLCGLYQVVFAIHIHNDIVFFQFFQFLAASAIDPPFWVGFVPNMFNI